MTTTSAIRATTIYTYTYLNASNVWVSLTQPLATPLPKDSRLLEQRSTDGVVTHYDYDVTKAHQVIKVTVGFGSALAQATTYGYDGLGRMNSTTVGFGTPLARTDTTAYNTDNTVAKTIQNYQGTGVFNAALPDRNITTTYGYDKLGRSILVTDTLGFRDATHYNLAGQVDWTIHNLTPLQFDLKGLPLYKAYAASAPDANIATLYGYDGLGRTALISQTGILTGTFNAATLRFTDVYKRVTKTDYDSLSRPITTTLNYRPSLPVLADTNVKLYTRYDGASNVITQTDALGRWTTFGYDQLNRPITTTLNFQDGKPLTGPRDADIVSMTRYDVVGRPQQQVDNWVDSIFSLTEPITDRVTLFQYDTLGRSTIATMNYAPSLSDTAINRTSTTAYDATTGRVTGQQDPLGHWVSQQYDLLGRIVKTTQNCQGGSPPATCTGSVTVEQNVSTQFLYDALNRTTIVTDALSIPTRSTYDGLGRTLTTIRNYQDGVFVPNDATKADQDVRTSYRYDALGRTLTTTDTLGIATNYAVNALGQTTQVTDPLGRVTLNGYDGTGALRWTKRPDGQITLYQIDGLGRTTTTIANFKDGVVGVTEAPDSDLTTRTVYDAAGRRLQMRVKTSATTEQITQFAYDGLDRLIGVTENQQTSGCTIAPCNVTTLYQYDRAGNRTKIIDPLGHARNFTYTAADEQKTEADALSHTTTWNYDAGGRVTSQLDPRGATNNLTFTYDGVDRLKTTAATNLPATITNNYDALGRRTSLVDSTGTTSFTPDSLGRIKQVNAPNTGIINYEYDGRGLRTRLTYPSPGTVINYTYFNDGQLQQVTQGATTPTTQATYAYDVVGRLAQVATKDSTTPATQLVTNYGYDGADRLRALRTSEAGTTVAGFQYQTDRLGLRTAITDTLPLSPALSATRIKTITFEGASLTDPVSGADSVQTTAAAVVLTTTGALKGSYAAVVPNIANSFLREDFAATNEVYATFYVRMNAVPSVSTRIAMFSNLGTTVGDILLTNAGKLQLRNDSTTIGLDSATLTVGSLYRVALHQKKGTGANALLEAYLANGDTVFTAPFAASATQTFTSQADRFQIGATVSTSAVAITVDDIAIDTGAMPPPSSVPTVPLLSTASFAAATQYTDNFPRGSALGDVNGDGKPDVVSASDQSNNVSILLGNGNGTFQTATTTSAGAGTLAVALGDLNGDGKLDIVATHASATTIVVMLGNGNGTFQAAVGYTVGNSPQGVAIGDFNADDKLDVVVANYVSGTISVLLGSGTGTLLAAVSYAVGTAPESVAIGDVNGDGKRDLVVTNLGTNNASVLLGNGNGTFQTQVTYAVGTSPQDVSLADLDRDGKLDIVTANGGSNNVSILLGNGNGTFQNQTTVAAGNDPASVAVGDLNGDGRADIVAANWYGGNLSVIVGNGNGTFQSAVSYALGTAQVHTAILADLNGDGKRDIITSEFTGSFIAVFLNQSLYPDTRVVNYSYDGRQRLVGATESTGTTYAYAYDLAGNRTSVQLNGGTPTVTTYNAANQINGFSYDNAGNLTNDGSAAYTYDALNRTTARGTTTYGYNGDGTLVSQLTGGVTTRYTQDLAAPLSQVLQTKVGAAAATDYIYGLNRLASLNGSTKTWYASDALGSVRRTVADSGTPLGVVNYDPWGTVESGTVPTFGFTGEVQDATSGLVNLRARWYSTARGTFTSADPFAGMPEMPYSQHTYQYAYSDPIVKTDPSGRCSEPGEGDDYCHDGIGYQWQKDPADQLIHDMWFFSHHPTTLAIQSLVEMSNNRSFFSDLLEDPSACFFDSTTDRSLAWIAWIDLVKTNKGTTNKQTGKRTVPRAGTTMDVKWRYEEHFRDPFLMFGKLWPADLSGNLLYGFIGSHIGFTSDELLQGAGAAQWQDHCNNAKPDPSKMGPGAFDCEWHGLPNTWDKPADQAEIMVGIELYRTLSDLYMSPFGENMSEKRSHLSDILLMNRDRIVP